MCPNRNLGQINRKQGVEAAASLRLGLRGSPFAPGVTGVEAAASLRLGLRGSPFAPGVTGVGICACCALAPPN